MKKAYLCLPFLVALTLLAGCGGGEDEGTESETPPVVEPSESEVIAGGLVDQMGIEDQIPQFKQAFAIQIRQEVELSDAEHERLLEILDTEFTSGFKPLMVNTISEYFTLDELKALRDDKVTPELDTKMKGLFPIIGEKSREWGLEVGKRAAETITNERED